MTLEDVPPLYVSEPQHDDMGEILDTLGVRYRSLSAVDLRNKGDGVVLLNCANRYQPPDAGLCSKIESFVRRGGSVIASDWACGVLSEISNAEFVELRSKQIPVRANIVDTELSELLGRSGVETQFHVGTWYKPTKLPSSSRVLIEAQDIPDEINVGVLESVNPLSEVLGGSGPHGDSSNVPIAYRYPFGEGSIVYTAFHNHEQPSEVEKSLLQLLVMVPIADAADTSVRDTYATITGQKKTGMRSSYEQRGGTKTGGGSDGTIVVLNVLGEETSRRKIELTPGSRQVFGRDDFRSELNEDEHGYISGEHFALEKSHSGDLIQIIDIDSTNGTEVDGRILEPNSRHPVEEGDEISLADGRIIVILDEVRD
jgi:hypothetical protein